MDNICEGWWELENGSLAQVAGQIPNGCWIGIHLSDVPLFWNCFGYNSRASSLNLKKFLYYTRVESEKPKEKEKEITDGEAAYTFFHNAVGDKPRAFSLIGDHRKVAWQQLVKFIKEKKDDTVRPNPYVE